MASKRITRSQVIGDHGIALVHMRVAAMEFLWHPTGGLEAGTDGFIEIRDPVSGDILSAVLKVQVKATEGLWQAESDTSFEYRCKEKDIDYWLASNVPVVLVCARPKSDEAYYKLVSDWFLDEERKKARVVSFDKRRDRFHGSAAQRLMEIAIPYEAGLCYPPPSRTEELVSNLLDVDSFGPTIYVAPAQCPSAKALHEELGRELPGCEWMLRGKQLTSFYDLSQSPWHRVCDTGGVERFDSKEWADAADPVRQREFVELLNQALRQLVSADMNYHRRRELYYFRATEDLSTKIVGGRQVFHGYPNRNDPSRIAYYRHSAFRGQFRRLDCHWFLEITPEYLFTSDGWYVSRFHGERVKKMKQIERNDAVRQQVAFWARYLAPAANLLDKQYPFLSLGELEKFDVDFGFDDKPWHAGHGQDDREARDEDGDSDSPDLFEVA